MVGFIAMVFSVLICLASFALLIRLLRSKKASLGLPIAYLFTLLFIHVPGAVAHIVPGNWLGDPEATEIGIHITAISAACFTIGVWIARLLPQGKQRVQALQRISTPADWRRFALYCLVGGLLVTYTLRLVVRIPSVGAVVEKGGGIWVFGVLLGFGIAFRQRSVKAILLWSMAMAIYPILTLLLGGFLSFGSTPVFVILSALVVFTRSHWRIAVAVPLAALFFVTLFLSYFQNRNNIRDAVWGGEGLESRVSESVKMITDFEIFDPRKFEHLNALDQRLNQNFFVGRAAQRLNAGEVEYLYGRSFWEGAISLVPRIIWPSKPVYGGSPKIIMEMTGFIVNDTTSYGVGNVMEFYINFGVPSVVIGFLGLGVVFGWLDLQAANALWQGMPNASILYFMPTVAMIHPNGSIVEMVSGGASAYLAGLVWRWLWETYWVRPKSLLAEKRRMLGTNGADLIKIRKGSYIPPNGPRG